MNPTKNMREPKLYMNPTKNLIELKLYMNPTKNLIDPKLYTRKNKDWLARNQDNVSEWGDMYIRGLLFQ